MFRRLAEGHTGKNFINEPEISKTKESKSDQPEPDYNKKSMKEFESIRSITALPNDRLLMYVDDDCKNYIALYDIHTKSFIKKIGIDTIKSCELLSDKEIIVYRHDENALIYDLDLKYLATITPSYHLSRLVEFNDDIILGHDKNERNNEVFTRSDDIDTNRAQYNFLNEVGYDKLGFLTPLGNNKIIAVYDNHCLRVIERKDKSFKRMGEMNFYDIDELIYSAEKMSDNRFMIYSSVANTIKARKEEIRHLRIYDTNTLQCIDDIILPKTAPVRKFKLLPDGKTAIGWDTLSMPHKIYMVDIETHEQATLKMPERVTGLTVLSNGNITVLLDYKKILEIEFEQIKQFKQEAKQGIASLLDSSTNLTRDPRNIVASYAGIDVLKLSFSKQDKIDGKALKEEISQKIKSLSSLKSFFFPNRELKTLKICQSFLENKQYDEKEFVTALSLKNGIHNVYADKVLAVIKAQNTSKRASGLHFKN